MLQIHKASAGSGKTFTLTRQYLKLLLAQRGADGRFALRPLTPHGHHQPKVHGRILAVTFTNKATDEMTARIIGELAALGGTAPDGRKSPYEDDFIKEFGTDAATLAMHARRALADVLYNFSWFNVSTIDSFFQRVLNTFTRELELSPTHDVEIDDRYPVAVAVGKMLQDINNPDEGTATHRRHLEEWLRRYMLSKLESGGNANLLSRSSSVNERLISEMRGFLNETYKINRAEIDEYFTDPSRIERFSQALGSRGPLAREAQDIMTLAAATLERMGEFGQKNVRAPLADFAAGNFGRNRTTTWQKAVADPTTAFRKTDKPDAAMLGEVGAALGAINNFIDKARLARLLFDNVYQLGLFGQVHRYLDEYRHEHDALLLSDTNDLLHRIISEDETPFIYERMGTAIHHFLIDEFQDTSQMQWENLKPLVLESLSRGNDNLIIGDEKQCIYRFRYSDPDLLRNEVQQQFPTSSELRGTRPEENTNHRSRARVISFNNRLFERLAEDCGVAGVYAHVNQSIPRERLEENKGYVRIIGIAGDTGGKGRKGTTDAVKEAPAVDRKKAGLDLMYGEIRRELDLGYLPGEICVLVRGNTLGGEIIEYLMDRLTADEKYSWVKVISDDAMAIEKSPAVRLLVSKLRFMADSVVAEATEGLTDSVSSRIMRLSNNYEHLSASGLEPSEALAGALAIDRIPDSVLTSDRTANYNLPSLVERMIARYIDDDMAAGQNMFISAFVDCVGDFCSRGAVDINTFLEWWDDKGHKARVTSPADSNALRVMTIHKSKGLEFKCVHVPFADWPMADFKDVEWFDARPDGVSAFPGIPAAIVPPMYPLLPSKYMADTLLAPQYAKRVAEVTLDELNVLYVAFTRAADELIVGYSDSCSEGTVSRILKNAMTALWPETDACCDEAVAECRVFGTPSAPGRKISGRTAITPEETREMTAYRTADRDDLWRDLRIERYCDYVAAAERGTALHAVLEMVTDTASIPRALDRAVYRGLLPADRRGSVEQLLRAQLEDERVRSWFDGYRRVLRERSLVNGSCELKRPDRVVWTADGHVDVIDYKFGAERDQYATQVREYVSSLRAMGYDNVRGFLWYVEKGIIDPVG